jgi:hypothetical protein
VLYCKDGGTRLPATEEVLQKLLDFHLKIGNYDVAEIYSKKLLALADKSQSALQDIPYRTVWII